jgi:hypothetical protein
MFNNNNNNNNNNEPIAVWVYISEKGNNDNINRNTRKAMKLIHDIFCSDITAREVRKGSQ